MTKIVCTIYRSPKKDGLYLYVPKDRDLLEVPAALLERFGRPEHAFTLLLCAERKLARADVALVISSIQEKGYFLQMPDSDSDDEDDEMRRLAEKNSKLGSLR